MTALKTYNDYIARVFAGFDGQEHIYGDAQSNVSNSVISGQSMSIVSVGYTRTLPTLPTGVTAYIIDSLDCLVSAQLNPILIGKAINLGNIDISGTSGTFTAGATMPTATELNVSGQQTYSAVIAQVTTVLNSTPGSLSITYNANDGSTGNVTTALANSPSATVNTCGIYPLNTPHWGVSQITAAVRTGGTTPTGVITFWGLLNAFMINGAITSGSIPGFKNMLSCAVSPFRFGAGDVIKFFALGSTVGRGMTGTINYVGDS